MDNTKQKDAKVCPECGHQFQGHGWSGIDGHWRGKNGHEDIMAYETARLFLLRDKYHVIRRLTNV